MKAAVTGWALLFNNIDLDGEYFTADTDFAIKQSRHLPLYFEHGQDELLARQTIGFGDLTRKSLGLFFDGEIEGSRSLVEALKEFSRDGILGFSSGSMGHLVERQKTPRGTMITRWPIGEISLSLQMAEPGALAEVKNVVVDIEAVRARVSKAMEEIDRQERFERARLDHFRVKHMLLKHKLGL